MQGLSPYKFYSALAGHANAKRENGFYCHDQKQPTLMKYDV